MSKHLLFIDDSGSRQWDNPYTRDFIDNPPERSEENMNYWRGNYFVLAGVHISKESLKELNPLINEKKKEYFGTKHVEIKSDWLRHPKKREKRYIKEYDISEERLREFVEDFWYSLFSGDYFTIQTFVLDKRYYAKRDSMPIALLTQVVFDRAELYPANDIEVVFDQMESDVKSKRHDHKIILDVSKQEINASPFFSRYSHAGVGFEESRNSNMLQLADTVAYNVFRQFVSYGNQWEQNDLHMMETYEYFKKMEYFHTSDQGRVGGFGIVKVPDPLHIPWKAKKTKRDLP